MPPQLHHCAEVDARGQAALDSRAYSWIYVQHPLTKPETVSSNLSDQSQDLIIFNTALKGCQSLGSVEMFFSTSGAKSEISWRDYFPCGTGVIFFLKKAQYVTDPGLKVSENT